jgi:hypothetical protein
MMHMEKVGQKFDSLSAADDAEDLYYKNMSPNDRVNLLLQLVALHQDAFHGSTKGFERVFRVTALEEG